MIVVHPEKRTREPADLTAVKERKEVLPLANFNLLHNSSHYHFWLI